MGQRVARGVLDRSNGHVAFAGISNLSVISIFLGLSLFQSRRLSAGVRPVRWVKRPAPVTQRGATCLHEYEVGPNHEHGTGG